MTQTARGPRVVEPAAAAEVAEALRACAREGAAVVAFGGSTLQSIGNAPLRCEVALRLAKLHAIHDYDPRDLTIGVEAGMTVADLARELAAHGQMLPLDVPLPRSATIGGTLAAGWIGPRRAIYGRPRDLLIGSRVALADGTLVSAGGMVVKNVTGYDMSKLYVGSLGTLGILVRANFKTLPRPAARRLAIAPLADDVRERAVGVLGRLPGEPSAALVVDGFARSATRIAGPRAVVLLEGSSAAVERATRELRSALGKTGVAETVLLDDDEAERVFAGVIDAYIEPVAKRSLTYRATGLPTTAAARTQTAARVAAGAGLICETIADLRTGDAILRFVARTGAELVERTPLLDAAVRAAIERTTILAGAANARVLVDAWGPAPSTLATMRALKSRFDPGGILAPGRYVGGI